jgi:hypothetical protein
MQVTKEMKSSTLFEFDEDDEPNYESPASSLTVRSKKTTFDSLVDASTPSLLQHATEATEAWIQAVEGTTHQGIDS